MATVKQSSGQIVFHQIADGNTVGFMLSSSVSTKQSHYKSNDTFFPDYTKTPQKLTPILSSSADANAKVLSTCTWYYDGVQITGSTQGFSIGTTSPFALTVNKNLEGSGHVVKCVYTYKPDAVHAAINLSAEIPLNRDEVAGSAITAKINNDSGGTVFQSVAGSNPALKFSGMMIRDGKEDSTLVTRAWAITGNNGSYYTITGTSAPSGSGLPAGHLFDISSDKKTITVYNSAIVNVATLRLAVTDNDPDSGTYGMTAYDYCPVVDNTDSIKIVPGYPDGDGYSTTSTVATRPVIINVEQGNKTWSTADFNGKTIKIYRATEAGALDTAWAPAAGNYSGWAVDSANHAISVTFNSATTGTDAARTVKFPVSDMVTTRYNTIFLVELYF